MSGHEQWVFCNTCQQCVSSSKTHCVKAFPEYGDETAVTEPMVDATVCDVCWLSYFCETAPGPA